MITVLRVDYASALGAPVEAGNGVLFSARVASTAAMEYLDGPERRDRAELMNIVKQLRGLVIVNGHPRDGLMQDGSSEQEMVGCVEDARFEPGEPAHAVATLHIVDPDTIAAIRAGKRGVSLGYSTTTTTDDSGMKWQHEIQLDHAAIRDLPRCRSCQINNRGRGDECTHEIDTTHRDSCSCGGACASCSTKGKGTTMSRNADGLDDEATARAKMIARERSLWKTTKLDGAMGGRTKAQAMGQVDPNDLANRSAREPQGFGARNGGQPIDTEEQALDGARPDMSNWRVRR